MSKEAENNKDRNTENKAEKRTFKEKLKDLRNSEKAKKVGNILLGALIGVTAGAGIALGAKSLLDGKPEDEYLPDLDVLGDDDIPLIGTDAQSNDSADDTISTDADVTDF